MALQRAAARVRDYGPPRNSLLQAESHRDGVARRRSGLPEGHLAQAQAVAWLADNQHKGTSELPAATIHSSAEFARYHLEKDPEVWPQQLVAQATTDLHGRVVATEPHRWRYAEPQTTFDTGAIMIDGAIPIDLAGEVFARAKIEGAFLSGFAAANATLARL